MKIQDLKFSTEGLITAVVQSVNDERVLMVAHMSLESLKLSLQSGQTHFFSRSRQQLWHKGESSGNTQNIESIHVDCDGDVLLVRVSEAGGACHTGVRSCFENFEPLVLE